MDDTTFRIEIEKLLVDKEYWRKYDWLNNVTANEIIAYINYTDLDGNTKILYSNPIKAKYSTAASI